MAICTRRSRPNATRKPSWNSSALAWKSIYDPLFGGLNPILQGAGIINEPLGWLSDSKLALGSVIADNNKQYSLRNNKYGATGEV